MNKVLRSLVLILSLPLLVPLAAMIAILLLAFFAEGLALRRWFWCAHALHGRDVLFVYSNSPNWQQHIEADILPRIRGRAVVLNWSERRNWGRTCPLPARFFRRFAGYRDFNPIAFVFRRGRIRTIRFYRAFLDRKHGKTASLQAAEAELFQLVEQSSAV